MIIQIFLTAGVSICLLYAFNQIRLRPLSIAIALVAIVGLVFIWYPDLTNMLAKLVGVGRGADLIYYIWIIIIMFALLNLHIRNRFNDRKIAAIVREIALAKPWKPGEDR